MIEYGSLEVAEAAGLAYQRLHRWCAAGAVRPSIANADGTGSRRRWSNLDRDALTDIAVIAEDLAVLEIDMSIELVTRLWDMCHADPDADHLELLAGSITVTVDRRDRRAIQQRRSDNLVRRGLEEE
jgi:DNA-binding transcriptional MerR regulator